MANTKLDVLQMKKYQTFYYTVIYVFLKNLLFCKIAH